MLSGLPWGLAMASGVNTYLPLFLLAAFARYSQAVHLSPRFQFLTSDQALIVLGAMAACEILAQKFPGLDNVWDFLHTLLRPLAGAIAAGATLTTNNSFEMIAAMLVGATIATASHSAKTTVRLASTTKSLGTANIFLSFVEDAAVVAGSLLSIFQPWVMLVIVLLFAGAMIWLGAWLFRTVMFDLRVTGAWLHWVGRKLFRSPDPKDLRESLLLFDPEHLKKLAGPLEPGEEIQGALSGWKRSRRGQRVAWLLVTDRRVLVIERRRLRAHKVQTLSWSDIALVRHRNLWLYERFELVTRQNDSLAFNLRKTHGRLGALAADRISRSSGMRDGGVSGEVPQASPARDLPAPALPR
ncbi:MAG TPA: DUF4126 domain-containing protein [Terriglobia bacterium]|nr:DUF4126 domain-containing protein [Terriglobia bacterium]